MHRAECFGVEIPLENLGTALAQRILKTLFRSRAETVQRNTKSRNSNLLHMSVLPASRLHAIAARWRSSRGHKAGCGKFHLAVLSASRGSGRSSSQERDLVKVGLDLRFRRSGLKFIGRLAVVGRSAPT